ncbi:ABC transporter substrate-binding protein [Paenibacillus ginsengarvi]|uniref:Extracellular solute-binding protein n=1 Tax=Paenibacillus ginsengarvi TaxID=400777 RepID=A0A3B0CME9_9BACL|nr:extracellular solute-binding protein [Paenibacillus ginsengarvi]RKN86130.1 extracellular solute-binding protein [Paenibacillus ginsengarvi]
MQLISIATTIAVLSACGQNDAPLAGSADPSSSPPPAESKAPPAPVKLLMLQDGATITKEEFQTLIAEPITAKYPHITVELTVNGKGDEGVQQLLASGDFPDLIFGTYPRITSHRELQTVENLNPMIERNKFDLQRFDPGAIATACAYSGSGNLYALPFSLNFTATFYNKEIFDKFGQPYPKEGMTWEDALNIAKSVSRTSDGVQYRGAFIQGIGDVSSQLSLPRIDQATGKASITSQEGWKSLFELYKAFNDLPGNKDASAAATLNNGFLKDQNVAMAISYDARFAALEKLYGTPQDFAWDVTQFPSFKEKPNVTVASSGHFLMLSSLGKHKEEAFRVIELLTSSEIQRKITDFGRYTALQDPAIKELYGHTMKSMQGKNIKAVFKSRFAEPIPPHPNNDLTLPAINDALTRVVSNEIDINTGLRQAEEAINKAIAERTAGKGK